MQFDRRQFLAWLAAAPAAGAGRQVWLYIGAYTNEKNRGISVARLDLDTGAVTGMMLAAETPNPTFLEIHPGGRWLYAVNEIGNFEGRREGSITAYEIDRSSGRLRMLNRVSTKGAGPCHVSLDRTGKMAMIANYGGGSVASYQIGSDGRLSEAVSFFQHEGRSVNAKRQEAPHAHSINPSPDNRFAVACDLGTDEIVIYAIDPPSGSLKRHGVVKLAPGSGPRHFAFHPNGRFGYSVNELLSTVTAFEYRAGTLKEIQTISTLPEGFPGQNTTAEIRVHPSGRWLYASNRGEDSIALFSVDAKTGRMARIENTPTQGQTPRNFYIEPSGRWLLAANQRSDNIAVFEIDAKSGKLLAAKQGITVGQPVCLRTVG
ncbi:MAG: lactonase family protein [Bryobacteraceae bacterium]|nr:lactonase family protein [Bryobacteraceae bacterium]